MQKMVLGGYLAMSLVLQNTVICSCALAQGGNKGIPSEVTGLDPKPIPMDTPVFMSGEGAGANNQVTKNSDLDQLNAGAGAARPGDSGRVSAAVPLNSTSPSSLLPAAATGEKPVSGGVSTNAAAPPTSSAPTTTKLYGRIEEISKGAGASFPIVLKALTPQFDYSQQKVQKGQVQASSAVASLYSGTMAKSFPVDYRGNWGGTLSVWWVQQDPICFRIDPVEAGKIQRIFKSGTTGQVNFMFANDTKGGIYLAPAQVMFQVPGKDVDLEQQMSKMMGGNLAAMGPMGQMMSQMAQNMPVPVVFGFGDIQSNSMNKGLSGNDFVQRTIKNTVRQLGPGVLEQQIVAECNEIMKATGQPRKRYEESILRFTRQREGQMYVQAAQVVYGPDRKFQSKIIMYGYVNKGQVMNTNPYSGMMQGMPGGAGQGLPGGLQGLPGIPGLGLPGGGQQLQLPPGFNPFQGLLGQ